MYYYAGKPGSGSEALWDMPPELSAALSPGLETDSLRLLDFLTVRVVRLASLMEQQARRTLSRLFDLSLIEWRCLAFLGELGPLTAAQLCRLTDHDKAQISHTLRDLAKRDLITRSTTLVKAVPVGLTPAGEDLFKRSVAARRRRERTLLGRLSPAQRVALYESLTILALSLVDDLEPRTAKARRTKDADGRK